MSPEKDKRPSDYVGYLIASDDVLMELSCPVFARYEIHTEQFREWKKQVEALDKGESVIVRAKKT